jgi:hypothetical protein
MKKKTQKALGIIMAIIGILAMLFFTVAPAFQ